MQVAVMLGNVRSQQGSYECATRGNTAVIIVSGYLSVAADKREEYISGCHSVIEQARAADGCLDFALSPDPIDPGRINVYERWESDEQLMKFRGSGPDDEQNAEILGADVWRYRISAKEAP
ncbi:putative quinol monooxygenase [Streptomyces inusitatus]|uniref:putative quinol monooxygenase n=1 Tax=Streptomyces inusitatus TaxID=68221 RepID=UPI001E4F3D10|nr:antibiotic biosynthesis monooxygenase family protein [Streptomyces inusitatus]